jgi:hypothetical protein
LSTLTLSALLLSGPACYNYVPVEVGAVPPGEDVRLRMTREGGEELARILESNEIRVEVSGQFEGVERGSVLLRVPVVRDPTGSRPDIQQVVHLPEAEVLTVDRRELSAGKTAALVGVGVGAVVVLLTQVFEVFDDSGRGGDDPEVSLVPLFNLLFGGR